jgi:hypothetical protein
VLCNRLDIRRGRKACQFPDGGNTIQEEKENCVYTRPTLVWLGWEAISRAQPLVVRFSHSSIAFGGLNEEVCVCISFEIEVIETSG